MSVNDEGRANMVAYINRRLLKSFSSNRFKNTLLVLQLHY